MRAAGLRGRRLHFVGLIGGADVSLLPHLIDHYRAAGIESFYFIRHALSADEPEYHRCERYVRAAGLRLFHTHVGPWSLELSQRLIRYALDENPDDWYVVADCDEFQVYDRPLPDLIDACESVGADYVGGCFLDRIGPDGGFPEVGTAPLWRQYPLSGSISAALVRALPLKVGITRGYNELLTGQHGAPGGHGLPLTESYIQVHHFKWTGSVLARLRRRLHLCESGRWENVHPAYVREIRRFLSYVDRHGGRIDITDPRFRCHAGGPDYLDYPYWNDVVREAQGWRWTLR